MNRSVFIALNTLGNNNLTLLKLRCIIKAIKNSEIENKKGIQTQVWERIIQLSADEDIHKEAMFCNGNIYDYVAFMLGEYICITQGEIYTSYTMNEYIGESVADLKKELHEFIGQCADVKKRDEARKYIRMIDERITVPFIPSQID